MKLPQEVEITVGGVAYKLSRFTIPLYQEFVEWVHAHLPDPFEGLADKVKGMPETLAKYLIDKAEERASKRLKHTDPEFVKVVESVEGIRKLFHLSLRKHHPSISEDEVVPIMEAMFREHGEGFLRDVFPADTGRVD